MTIPSNSDWIQFLFGSDDSPQAVSVPTDLTSDGTPVLFDDRPVTFDDLPVTFD